MATQTTHDTNCLAGELMWLTESPGAVSLGRNAAQFCYTRAIQRTSDCDKIGKLDCDKIGKFR